MQEAYRVLQPGGVMVFDDLTKPRPDISDEARAFVYDRLLFDTDYSFYSYLEALRGTGFRVLEAREPVVPPGPQLCLPVPDGGDGY